MDNDLDTSVAPVDGGQQPTEPPSLRDTLSRAVETSPIFSEPDREPGQQERDVARAARERDGQGRFARKNADGSEVPTQEQVRKAQPNLSLDPDEPLDPEGEGSETDMRREDPIPNVDNAPKSWKAAARERWATADPVIKAEVHRREREATRAIAEHAPVKKFVGEFQQAIQPFAQHYGPRNIPPLQLMRNLMEADVHLSTAPMPDRARFMAKLIKDYKIDINALDAAIVGDEAGLNTPAAGVEALLNERLAPINEFVQSEQQRRQAVVQQERTRASEVLRRMEADTQNFPHFALVAADMADVTEMAAKRGVYITPAEAYKRAVAMSPEAQAADQGRAGQQRARDAHDAATRSLGASLSVSGAPAGLKTQVPPSDLRGTIQAAWEAAQGR